MKKIVFAAIAAILVSTGAMAQQNENKPERRQFSQSEMIQHRTDNMVEKYKLSADQKAKLVELNTKYADKMMPRGRRNFGPDARRQGQRPQRQLPDSLKQQRPRNFNGAGNNREDFRKAMEEYNTQLKAILTEEQYKAYEEDQKKMREQGPRNRRQPAQ